MVLHLQVTGRMEPVQKQFTDLLMTKRLQTLQSVDHAIARVKKINKEEEGKSSPCWFLTLI